MYRGLGMDRKEGRKGSSYSVGNQSQGRKENRHGESKPGTVPNPVKGLNMTVYPITKPQ